MDSTLSATTSVESSGRETAFAVVLCAAAFVLLVGSMTGWIKADAFGSLGVRLSHNSEAYLVILVMVPWLQFLRPRLQGSPNEWAVTLAAAAVCFAVGLYFFLVVDFGGDTKITTLNEGLFGLAFLLPYVTFRRPLPRWVPWTISGAVLAVTIAFNSTQFVVDMAEVIGFVVLMPVGLDIVDGGILDPDARTQPLVRYVWYAFLVVAPVVFAVVQTRYPDDPQGLVAETNRYLVRLTEGFIATLVICVYFAVVLGRTGRSERGAAGVAAAVGGGA